LVLQNQSSFLFYQILPPFQTNRLPRLKEEKNDILHCDCINA
jgi:hypothetical protein